MSHPGPLLLQDGKEPNHCHQVRTRVQQNQSLRTYLSNEFKTDTHDDSNITISANSNLTSAQLSSHK